MIFLLFVVMSLVCRAIVESNLPQVTCSTVNDCSSAIQICRGGNCNTCSSNPQCSDHTTRTTCNNGKCVQCTSDPNCGGAGKVCITSDNIYLCGTTCSSPTSACASQCLWISSKNAFYCLACENNLDCQAWSGNPSSICNSGVCSPVFLSCGQNSHCSSALAAQCSAQHVCVPCTQSSHCAHLTATPARNSGTCVPCIVDADCPSSTAAQCSAFTCIQCDDSIQCAHLTSTPLCETATGTCVQCLTDSDCKSDTAAFCSSNTCIPCTENSQCEHFSTKPVCKNPGKGGKCVQCTADDQCSSPSAAKCVKENVCTGCKDSKECAHLATTPFCNKATGVCYQCQTDIDCSSISAAQCSSTSQTCVACTASSQCTRFTATPLCFAGTGECVKCLTDSDCPTTAAAECSASDHTCVACTAHSHCARFTTTPVCSDLAGGTCVQCMTNLDCPSAKAALCSAKTCIACTANSQCAHLSSTPICNTLSGICVQCLSDSDCLSATAAHCSASNYICVACSASSHCTHLTSTPVCKSPGLSGVCVQCISDSDCPATAATCSTSNICLTCTANSQCARFPTAPICKNPGSSGVCVQCIDNPDCTSVTAADCASTMSICQGCSDSTNHCSKFPSTPICKNPGATTGVCVQCTTDTHCPTAAAAHCSAESNTCSKCTTDDHCTRLTSTPFCNVTSGTCVQCLSNTVCTGSTVCSGYGVCAICTSSAQCTTSPICSTTRGVCVECQTDADCHEVNKGECSSAGTCVACTSSAHCAHFELTPACNAGVCVPCVYHSDCPNPAKAQCSGNTCIACTDSAQCAHLSTTPVCKSPGTSGLCVQCTSHSDCSSPIAAQCSASNTCVACTATNQCKHLSSTPVCNTASGTCVACNSDADCISPIAAHCSGNTCSPCSASSQCAHLSATPACSPSYIGVCVECDTDADCPSVSKAQCSLTTGTCVPCTASSHCSHLLSTPVCKTSAGAGLCVECLSDSDCVNPLKNKCLVGVNLCVQFCTANCLECLSSTACKLCLPGYYLLNSSCMTTCPAGYWQNDQTQTCELCDPICQTCSGSATVCTSCSSPYVLDGSKCQTPPGTPPPTVILKSSSDPQTFLLVFSNPMAVTPEILTQTLKFSLTGMSYPTDYYLLNVTKQPDSKTFKIIFNFTKSLGIETLTATFTNQKAVSDTKGLVITQESVNTKTVRFTFFTMGEKAAAESLTSAGSAVSNAALSSSVGMFVAGGSGGILWAFLGLFQIVNYLLFLNVNYPYNVVTFFKLFSTSSLNGIVPNPMEYLFPSIWEEMEAGLPSPPKFADNEMDALYLNNAGQTIVGWIAVGMLYLLTKIILFTFRTTGKFNRIIINFKEKFEWGLVYNALIGTYPELIIASCLQFVNMDFTTPLHKFSSIAALFVGTLCFWAPFIVTYALESSAEVLGSQQHERKHGALYEPFIVQTPKYAKVSPEIAYYRRNFMAFIFLRKMAYFSGIVLAYDIPLLQMLITCCSGLVLLIFMIKVKPFRTKSDAWMNVGSEVFLVLIHLVIFVFAGDDITLKLTDNQRKNVGWVVIFLCSLMIVYNALFIFAQQMVAFWNIFKLIVRVICKKSKAQEKSSKTKKNYRITLAVNPNQEKIRLGSKKNSNHNSKYIRNNFIQNERADDLPRRIRHESNNQNIQRKRRVRPLPPLREEFRR